MARKIRSAQLENRSARFRLPLRKKPYTARVAQGIRLAYRRNQSGGVWSVLKSDGAGGTWLQRFALADDHEDSNGSTILDYWRACEVARKLARGDDAVGEVEAGKLLTIGEALASYERDLRARDGGVANAAILRRHLPPVLLSKPVAMLTAREVRAFRDSLLEKGLKRSTCNRYLKSFVAALTLAANDDDRITNRKVWKLAALREAANPRNIILTDQQVRDVVAASYQTGERFGAYVELLAVTGTRPSQARRLTVADLEADHPGGPRVQMPNSRKGKGRKRGERVTLPIPAGRRTDNEPLLRDDAGNAWTTVGHRQPFMAAAAAAGLPKYVTAYALRHSSITRSLLRGVPVRLVSAAHDTSVAMVEATYSKYIAHPGADLMRGAMIDFDEPAPAAAKVVSLARAKAAG